ncbi:MAG: magnesium transporter [Rhodospirillales bacterium]|nr:MAG: magnesium transporter [Rhodospirillales bacterium]
MSESDAAPPSEHVVEPLDPVTPAFVRGILDDLARGRVDEIRRIVADLGPADVAYVLEQVAPDERSQLVGILKDSFDPETLVELDDEVRDDVLDSLDAKDIAAAAQELDADDAAEIIEDLTEQERREVLAEMPAAERAVIEETLAYPEDSAGRLMQRTLVAVPDTWTVGQVIDHCREATDLPDDVYDLFVTDSERRLRGSVALGRMLRAKRPVPIVEIMDPDIPSIPVTADQEAVAHVFRDQNLVSCPVVDDERRLLGVIMVDDVVDVIDEEAEADIAAMGGVATIDIHEPVARTTRSRFWWLFINLGTAFLASAVIGQFEVELQKIVALAVLMPIVASMGGNAGTQTVTVAVRALATGELTATNALRFVVKEIFVGGANGIMFAVLVGAVTWVWFQDWRIAAVIGAAMVLNLVAAGLAGTLIPLGLQRARIDPAVSSTVFLTTVTDVIGFLAFLGLAALFLL